MVLELRPTWCLSDSTVEKVFRLGAWTTGDGHQAFARDGDDWRPGEPLVLSREIEFLADLLDLRRELGLGAGQSIGLAARWTCRATAMAGVHTEGPLPLPINGSGRIVLEVPSTIASSVEIETCLIARWSTSERPQGSCPDGALLWSDGWTLPMRNRTILLEGDETRIPVRTVAFHEHFGQPSGALWAIDLDTTVELNDILANVVTVLLNKEVLQRDFRGADGEPDASRLHDVATAGISVDLIRCLTSALLEDLSDGANWAEMPDGSVGAMLNLRLLESFGSVSAAKAMFESDQQAFSRLLWHRFAPNSWSVGR
jgi:hypothetical protein